jgi:hypothetical protein
MNRVQGHLAQANGHIAALTVQIVRQREIVKYELDTGQRSERAESLLDALEGSLRIFEKHRIFLLSLQRQPSEQADHPSAPTRRAWERDGPGLAMTGRAASHGRADHVPNRFIASSSDGPASGGMKSCSARVSRANKKD